MVCREDLAEPFWLVQLGSVPFHGKQNWYTERLAIAYVTQQHRQWANNFLTPELGLYLMCRSPILHKKHISTRQYFSTFLKLSITPLNLDPFFPNCSPSPRQEMSTPQLHCILVYVPFIGTFTYKDWFFFCPVRTTFCPRRNDIVPLENKKGTEKKTGGWVAQSLRAAVRIYSKGFGI